MSHFSIKKQSNWPDYLENCQIRARRKQICFAPAKWVDRNVLRGLSTNNT
jgi:hypothetical protein